MILFEFLFSSFINKFKYDECYQKKSIVVIYIISIITTITVLELSFS